jgi:hypothetical protein
VTYVDMMMMLILHRKIREFYQVMTTRAMIGVGLITHDRIHNSSPSRNSFFSSYNSAELLYDAIKSGNTRGAPRRIMHLQGCVRLGKQDRTEAREEHAR